MSKKYTRKTSRSRRKPQNLDDEAIKVELGDRRATVQMILPMEELMNEVALAIENMASQVGLLLMKGLIDQEVEQIAGQRYTHCPDRPAHRWGKEQGHVLFSGRKVAIERPRVRGKNGREIPLQRYRLFQAGDRLEQAVQQRILRRVSMRDYEGVIDDLCDGYGIRKSSVSRHWKAASAKQLKQLMERRLDDLDLAVLMIDGIDFHNHLLVVALGIDAQGRKHVLGLWPGASENAQICGALLDDLLERGLMVNGRMLFVLDGSKALRKAVDQRFGQQAVVQRCQVHKRRNILDHLPANYHRVVELKLCGAWGMTDYAKAKAALKGVLNYLEQLNPAAARSLEEAFEETLTLHRLGLPPLMRESLQSTNIIESCFSRTRDISGNVKHCGTVQMACRWAGASLLAAEQRFHRVKGYKSMPVLIAGLRKDIIDAKEAVA
jgi:transposase-like protein